MNQLQVRLNQLLSIGDVKTDSEEDLIHHRYLMLMLLLMSCGGLFWGIACTCFGYHLQSTVAYGYVVVSFLNVIYFYRFKNFRRVRFIQVTFSMLLPFLFQAVLGGFVQSGGSMLWAFLPLVASFTFQDVKKNMNWLFIYLFLTILSGVLDSNFNHLVLSLSPGISTLFFTANFAVISAIVFFLISYFIKELDRTKLILNMKNIALRESQSRLVQSEKMASLGQLTAGIAHEINNPINFVKSNISPLKRNLADLFLLLETAEKHLAESGEQERVAAYYDLKRQIDFEYTEKEIVDLMKGMEEGAKRTAEIVSDLRSFSRLDEDIVKLANLHEGLDSTLMLLRKKAGEQISFICKYGELPEVECFPGKINQVFMNILVNGIDAIPDKGTITIETEHVEDAVFIRIADTGTGMPEEVRQHIFQPFYTTKAVGMGTGLGLSICYGIIEKHKGTIKVTSELNKGTTFEIRLPVLQLKDIEIEEGAIYEFGQAHHPVSG